MNVQKRNMIEEYEINPFTMLIVPCEYGSKIYSRIYELDQEYLSPFKPMEIIKKGCQFFGASYQGRKEGTRQLVGITHKVPIAIDPTNFIYFFPTSSPSKSHCIWVAHEHVLHHERDEQNHTIITFRNKKSITIPVSFNTFQNQLFRTAMLRTKLAQRMEETERKMHYMLHNPRYMKVSEKKY